MKYFKNRSNYFFDLDFINSIIIGTSEKAMINITTISKLFLMTDGIYDPKFVVESKLENMETWKNFLLDLSGENEDKAIVDFINDSEIENQLSRWMDFWSKGNHDDRTLAIIY